MSYSDLRKKHGITSSTGSKTGSTSQSGGGYAALQKKYGINYDVDEKYLTTFISDTNSFFDSISAGSISYNDATSRLRDLSTRYDTVEGWLYQNKSNLDEETYKSLSSLKDKFSGIKKYYSQWETEEDYIKGATETSGDRQQRYEDNLKKIEELKAQRSQAATGSVYNPDSNFMMPIFNPKVRQIDDQIKALEAENLKYERGEDGYISKVVDEHRKTSQRADFETTSANRDYTNATRDDLWNYDMSASEGSEALSNGGYFDEEGNIRDSKGNIVQYANAPAVEDKLGMFLSAGKDEVEEAYNLLSAGNGNYTNTWANLMQEGDQGSWKYLDSTELGIYYTYLGESQEKAYQYLADMKTELNRRQTLDEIGQWNTAYDDATFLEKIALNAATIPAKFVSNAAGFVEDTYNTVTGNDINPYSSAHSGMHYSQTIRGNTAEELDATGFKIPVIDFTLGDIYQTGMSRLDSALATSVFGGGGTVFLGMGAAEEEAYKLYKQGASAEQITLGALSAGAAEAIWEYVSCGKLKEIQNIDNPGAWVKSVLVQGWNELTEEAATEVSNIVTNALVMGSQSDLAELYKKNEEDAFKTFVGLVKQTAQAGFGGFLGGLGAGAGQATGVYVDTTAKYRDAGRTIMGAEGGVDALKQLANDVAGVSDAKMKKTLTNQAGKVSSEVATGNGLVGKAVAGVKNSSNATKAGRLYNTVNTANNLANASANQADIAKSLQRKGFNAETANDIAEALVKSYNGQELTEAQAKLLESAKDSKVVQEAISNIMTNEQSTMGQRSQNIRDFQEDVNAGIIAKEKGINKDVVKALRKGDFSTAMELASESNYEVSVDGKWANSNTGDTIEPQGLVQAEDGTYMINAKDADPVASGEVSYPDANHAIVYETFLNLERHYGKDSRVIADMDLSSRNELLGLYNPQINKDGGKFVNGILDAYFYGHRGVDLSAASKDSPVWELTEQQRKIAWNTGRAAGIKTDTDVQSNVDSVYAEAKKILESGKAKKGSYHAVLEDGISPTELNNKQRAVYRYADEIAQGIQTNIRVYNGANKAQGFYNHETDEIWLNLNAADTSREHILAFTLAHELVHRGKKGSPAQYQAFTEFLMKEYGKQGVDVEAMIAEQIQAAKEFNKTVPEAQRVNMTREKALEEVVSDACQRMLLDTNAGQKLAEFGAQSKENKRFLEDLKRWITELLDKLRNYFRNAEPDSLAAKAFDKFDANVKQMLADMYVDMSIDAGEKLSTIKAAFGEEFASKFFGIKDIRYNLAAVDSHKAKLQKAYSEESSTDLKTLMARYDKIIEIWNRLGGELNSKFLADWNSKVGKDRTFTIFKAQVGYKYNVELSSMCKKGVPLFEAIDTIVKQEVMKELGTEVLGKAEKEILYDILKQHHFEIPCAICYVEQARQREGDIIDAFLNGKVEKNAKGETTKVKLGWNQVLDSIQKEMKANGVDYTFAQVSRDIATEKYTPANLDMDMKTQAAFYAALKKIANQEIARYNKAEGKKRKLLTEVTPEAVKACFKGTLPANLKIFKVLFNEPSSRFKIQNDLLYSSIATQNLSMAHNELYGLFNSQGGVSGYKTKQGTTIYWGDILGKSWKPDTVRNEGGVRNQSNSDFQMYTLLDQAQMYIDFTAKGYYLQAYTKVLSELKLFGLSRGKINASLIPKVVVYYNADGSVNIEKTMASAGLDENGNPIYDDIEGINHDEAFMLIEDPEYSKNICGICIGYSDAHIFKLLDDPRVQQIIGFHDKTDDGTKRYKGARYAKNYNGLNEATKVDSDGKTKTVHIGFNSYVKRAEKKFKFNAETETFEGTVNYNGKTYTADDIPRLATDLYLEMCAKKEYTPAYADFSGHRNYYKLLADFGLYDSQGHYAPHRKVLYNMPDTVPYLDANGKKQTMRTDDYIKAELEKELAVRDSIAAALADTSSEGIIPQFKAAVKKSQEEKSFSLPKVFTDAVEKFGTTTDFAEAGFILPGGEMLKFTDDKHRGERQYDHRAIGMVYGVDVDLGVNHGFNKESGKFLDEFVENGGIRFDAGEPDLNMDIGLQLSSSVPITKAQEQLIRDLVEWKRNREELYEANMTEESFLYDGPLAIRIDFGGNSNYAVGSVSAKDLSAWGKKSLEYDGGNINADRIIADIRHYYKTGETRQQSVVSQFHYSYSLPKTDSEGNNLSTEQQEFFKDSVVRDADGKLMVMYHGTANGGAFTVFDGDKLGNRTLTSQIGQGFYFTNVKKEAESYMKNVDIYGRVSNGTNPNLHQVYLNITNPFDVNADKLNIAKVKSVYMDGTSDHFFDSYISHYLNNKTVNGRVFTKAEVQDMSKADRVSLYVDYLAQIGTKELLSNMVQAYKFNAQSQLLASMKNRLGYDGIVEEFKPGQYQYVAFSSEQIKNVDNTNPTTDPDIRYSLPKVYDISKPFADQVDDWLNGNFPETDTLLVGGTPDVLKKIGVTSLPITIAQRNMKDNLLGQYRGTPDEIADHLITPDEMKKLPDKIADPVAIIVDRREVRGNWTIQENTIDILVEMEINGKQALVPIRLNGNARQNGSLIDANVIASVHGNKDAVDRLDYALKNDSDDNVMVFYVNKKKTTAVLRKAGYPITGVPNISDGFIHSISDPGSPVKLRINSQTETRQFKNWFKGSKVVNDDGTPRIVYHHTNAEFWTFDTERSGSNQGKTLGDGIYISTSPDMFSYAGKNRMELYAVIRNPFEMKLTKKQATYVLEKYAAKKHNLDQYDGLYRNHAMGKLTSPVRVFDYLSQYAVENGIKVSDILKDLGYDGVHSGSEWVAFDANQVKSATDNIGTFDVDNPDIRYKLPVGEDTSPRSLLANAFEGLAKDDIEKNKIREYKEKVELINAEEQKLRELNEQIKELSFAKGKRDTKKISALRFDAMQASNRINTYDKQLLRLEASKPLQDVLAREKRLAYKKAEQRGKEALKAYRDAERKRDEQWHSEVKEKYQASKKKAIETREKREAREKLQKLVIDTAKWISYPAKTDVKCPDILKQPYADFLNGIDLSSKRLAEGGDPTKNDLRLANAMGSLATALDRIMTAQDPSQDSDKVLDTGYLDLPADFVQKLRDMTENIKSMMVEGDYVVNNMTAAEVRQLSQMIRTLNHAIKTMSNLYANLRFANIEELGFDTMEFMDALGEIEKTGNVKDFVQWDNALPYYAFKRFGKGGESVFEGLMDAQDKLAFLAKEIFAFQEKTWTGKEAKAWSEDTHTITLPNGNELTLTTADAMSIYCLSRREQGLQHLLGGGTRVMGLQKGSQKAKDSRSMLTIEDVSAIISSLTDRQKQVAEGIQEFMSTVCSEWGNEISMKRFLTKDFTEKFYFPIESNDENLPTKDPAAQQSDLFRLLNISATKPLTPGANNEVIIRNVFDVFTGHASDMARLNAYGMALLDYMKWLNYREKTVTDEGQVNVKGVRKSMEKAYGNAAKSYVLNLVKDVNGRPSDGGDPNILMKWMRAGKTASVGSSLRVASLQITSYPRAALVLSPKSLTLGLSKLPQIEKAKKYCGIALWKSFGFYDTNISRSIEDQMKGVTDVKQKLIELSLKGAEWGDAITWGALWNACEYEVAKTTKNKVGSEEFYQEVGNKLREVVYRTQVVDSTLTRSQIMRSKRGMAQEAAAFMSEPTLSANILMDAGFEFNAEKRRTGSAKAAWKKTGSYIGRAVAVYAIGQLTAALMEGLWDAWRDDDDEEFDEKYIDAFVENLVLDLVPFNKIPIVSDVFEAALAMFGIGFYSSDKMSTTWLTQAVSAVDAWKDALSGESSATVYNALYKSTRSISSFLGVSISGVMREAVALWNNTAGAYDPTLKILTYGRSKGENGDMLLDAMIKGDARLVESIKAEFADEDAYSSAVRTAIKNRYDAGEIDSNAAEQYLVKFGGLEDDDAYWKVQEWEYETETGEDFKKYNDFYTAVQTGKDLKAVIKRYTDNGVEAKTLASQITSYFKPLYKEMSNTERAAIKGYLLNAYQLLGYNRSEKSKDIDKWLKD